MEQVVATKRLQVDRVLPRLMPGEKGNDPSPQDKPHFLEQLTLRCSDGIQYSSDDIQWCCERDPFLRQAGTSAEEVVTEDDVPTDEPKEGAVEKVVKTTNAALPQNTEPDSPVDATDSQPWYRPDALDLDAWEVQYRGNSPIGYSRRQIEIGRADQTNSVRIDAETKVRIKQNDQDVEQILKVSTIERPDGELLSFEVQLKVGDQFSRVKGRAAADHLKLARNEEGRTVNRNIPWNIGFRGPFALMQSLKKKPMRSGEVRQFSYLDPVLVDVVEARLVAGEWLETAVLDGSVQRMMEVTATIQSKDKQRVDVLWVDANGDIWKSYTDQLQLRTFRCNRDTAMVMKSVGDWESANKVSINLRKPLGDPKLLERIVFQVESRELDPFLHLSPSNQKLKSLRASSCEVSVMAVKSSTPSAIKEEKPDASWLAADPYLQVDDPAVRKWVESLLQEETKGPAIVRLTKGIHRRLAKNTETKHFASAKEIVEKPEGDSSEFAVLLATAARIQGIPSRLAIGMLAKSRQATGGTVASGDSTEAEQLDLHLWTEVWMGERWIPLDSWSGDAPATPNRIKFREFDLRQENPYEVMLAAVKLMQQLDVEVKEVEAKTTSSNPEMIGTNLRKTP